MKGQTLAAADMGASTMARSSKVSHPDNSLITGVIAKIEGQILGKATEPFTSILIRSIPN
jgi:hypothetical protein